MTWNDRILISCFEEGLVGVCQVLAGIDGCENLEQFLDLVLRQCGSSYTVGPVVSSKDYGSIITSSLASACPDSPSHLSKKVTTLTFFQPQAAVSNTDSPIISVKSSLKRINPRNKVKLNTKDHSLYSLAQNGRTTTLWWRSCAFNS